MSALASLVPFLDDLWLSAIFLGVSGFSLIRVLRQEAEPGLPTTDPRSGTDGLLPRHEDSGPSASCSALIRINDALDRTTDALGEIGKAFPLIIPGVVFVASTLAHGTDGNWYWAAVSLAGAIFTSVPIVIRARRGIFKLRDRWLAVEALRELEDGARKPEGDVIAGAGPDDSTSASGPADGGSLPGEFEDGPATISHAGIDQEG